MKSYTDLEQSRKLAEILSLESADMVYVYTIDLEGDEHYDIDFRNNQPLFENDVPAWSLAALISFLKNQNGCMSIGISNKGATAFYYKYNSWKEITIKEEEAVDACVELIIKLKKNGII